MHVFKAKVISGRGRGRQIGFPTANLNQTDLPLDYGVYLVAVKLNKKIYQGLMHYGLKRTFNEMVSCEIHLKNFHDNIYGRTLEVEAIRKIREVKKFSGVPALKKQIKKDLMELDKS
jgi:riboflavin kinase/FMN adenylyltransferase